MDSYLTPAVTFGQLLRENPQASQFYDRCTPEQRQAILLQLPQFQTPAQVRAFVDKLPSAAL
mgnify:FL=1